MKQQRKATVVRVSRYRSNKRQNPSVKNKRSTRIIQVTVGLPTRVHSTDSFHSQNLQRERKVLSTQNGVAKSSAVTIPTHFYSRLQSNENTKKVDSWSGTSHSVKITHLSRSARVIPHEDVVTGCSENKDDPSDRAGMTNDYHRIPARKKKTKCSRRCLIASLLITFLLLLVIAAILLALLIKPKTKTTVSSMNMPVLRWNTTGITIAGLSGNPGNNSDQLNAPVDVILDYSNNLYIADYNKHRIQKYFFGSSIIKTMAGNGTAGLSPSQLRNPARVIIDSYDNLYISDTWNYRVQFWSNGATSGQTVAGTGIAGNATNQLNLPHGLVLHPTSNILYIADYQNHRIMSYAPRANNGTLILGGIGPGTTSPQLYNPVGLYFDSPSNSLVIANHLAHNIVRYVLGANGWTLVAGDINGSSGVNSTLFNRPVDMTFDPMGNMYVADRNNHRIQFFYTGEMSGTTITGITGVGDSNATTLNRPWTVRLDRQLNLYVADMNNHRIQKFLRY